MDSGVRSCPDCGTEIAPGLLACPKCALLVHASALKKLAAQAEAAEQAGDLTAAIITWRDAIALLPPDSRQHAAIVQRMQALQDRSAQPEAKPAKSAWKKGAAGLTGLALLLFKFKSVLLIALTKGKFLLLGLTKAPTLFSMLLSMGVYWSIWGWKFAVGFVVSIYIHEMGHVWMLRRYGIRATAPMFIPMLGALVRLDQRPATVIEDARVGLAGPFWGLGAGLASYAAYWATSEQYWGALAQAIGMINLFNLLPVWQLDGARGLKSLTKGQRWLVVLAAAGTFFFSSKTAGDHETHRQNFLLVILALFAAVQIFLSEAPKERDDVGLFQFVLLIMTLGGLAAIDIPLLLGR